jgi:hypothetical protein
MTSLTLMLGRRIDCQFIGISSAVFLIAFLLCPSTLASAQNSPVQNSPVAKGQLLAAFQTLGWSMGSNSRLDLFAAGMLSFVDEYGTSSPPFNVRIKYRGPKHYRMDIDGPSGTRSVIVNDIGGVMISEDGKGYLLSASAAIGLKPPIFPFLHAPFEPTSLKTDVEDTSSLGISKGATQRLRVMQHGGSNFESNFRSRASEATLWLGADHATPIRIDYYRLAADNHYSRTQFTLLLSDYRRVGGIAVPFRVEEQVDGKSISIITFQDVRLGSGVQDSDFSHSGKVIGSAQ